MMGTQDFVGDSPTNNTPTHQALKSPVPYIIGGIAAMMALVAFGLLMLVCSFNKEYDEQPESNSRGNDINTAAAVERGEKNIEGCREDTEVKVVVIMAGEERPTFLAKPAISRAGDMENTV